MPEPSFLGVDASWTALAICEFQSVDGLPGATRVNEIQISTKPADFRTQYHRLDYLGAEFIERVDRIFPAFIAIEGYAMGSKTRPQMAGELGGHLRWLLMRAGYPFLIVPPTTLKQFVSGKGNSPKEVMMQQVLHRWGYIAKDNNACDAYGLARLAWHYPRKAKTKSLQTLLSKCELVEV